MLVAEKSVDTPIDLAVSVKAQVVEVQMQLPLIGSQKGVEQLVGTGASHEVHLHQYEYRDTYDGIAGSDH